MRLASSFRAVSLALPLTLAACGGNTAVGGGEANPLDAEDTAAITQLNTLRMQAGVSLVTACTSLNVSAFDHSQDMMENNYLAEVSPSGSDVRSRACAAGYQAACGSSIPMAELVAEGYSDGMQTINQWQMDPTSAPILVKAGMVVVGIGRVPGAQNVYWTLDLSSSTDPSCN